METDADFWEHAEELVRTSRVVIDRPKGSRHPRYPEFVYPVDYGYLDGTSAADGAGIDVWVGSGDRGMVVGIICVVDLVKKDSEIKILVRCSEAEQEAILAATNDGGMRGILVRRDWGR